ncbi:MAG: hypothetical protein QOE03_2602, partial [Micromonosporaceae bacterium]|nr:hypothetical protein [Micromonosporaceae bacterium]
ARGGWSHRRPVGSAGTQRRGRRAGPAPPRPVASGAERPRRCVVTGRVRRRRRGSRRADRPSGEPGGRRWPAWSDPVGASGRRHRHRRSPLPGCPLAGHRQHRVGYRRHRVGDRRGQGARRPGRGRNRSGTRGSSNSDRQRRRPPVADGSPGRPRDSRRPRDSHSRGGERVGRRRSRTSHRGAIRVTGRRLGASAPLARRRTWGGRRRRRAGPRRGGGSPNPWCPSDCCR